MHLADVTMLHGPAVGGVSRYLSTKRRWLHDNTRVRHSQVVATREAETAGDGEVFLPAVRVPGMGDVGWPWQARRWIDTICALEPDVIEANDLGTPAWFALAAARRLDVPLLAFAHVDIVRFARERRGRLAERTAILYTRAFYERCAVVIAPSEYMRRRIASWGIGRVLVRHLGVDPVSFHPRYRDDRLRARLGLPQGTRLMIYVGRFSAEKRIGVLLDAMRRLGAPYHLLLVGGGETPALPANVTRLPFVASTPVLARLIASADALVHAGDVETFGLVYLEAMACGRPVVAVDGGAAAEIVDAGCGVLAQPASPASLAAAVAALYERDIEAMGQRARQRVENHFTLDLSMQRLLTLYRTAKAAPLSEVPALVAT
jgi:alpha-1,6-mannosyltransferase